MSLAILVVRSGTGGGKGGRSRGSLRHLFITLSISSSDSENAQEKEQHLAVLFRKQHATGKADLYHDHPMCGHVNKGCGQKLCVVFTGDCTDADGEELTVNK